MKNALKVIIIMGFVMLILIGCSNSSMIDLGEANNLLNSLESGVLNENVDAIGTCLTDPFYVLGQS